MATAILKMLISELAEALRDLDDVKKNRNEVKKENKELKVPVHYVLCYSQKKFLKIFKLDIFITNYW